MKIPPIQVVRSSLVSKPVMSVVAPKAASFSDVLATATSVPRSINSAYFNQDEMEARVEASIQAQRERANVAPVAAWSPYSKSSVDLYVQLETLLREKSLLIAVV